MDVDGYNKSAVFYDYFDTKDNIDFFHSFAMKEKEVLDIGAGTGRIAIPLAKRSLKVYCVEPSKSMLEVFKRKLEKLHELKSKLKIIEADATNFRIDKEFNYAYMSGVFDHFLTKEQRLEALRNIRNHLARDGILVFDVFIGLMKSSSLKLAGEYKEDDITYQRFVKSKIKDNLVEVTLVYEVKKQGKIVNKIEEKSYVGIISKEEVFHLIQESNFVISNVFSDYDFSLYDNKEKENLLILEVKKE